MSPEFLNSLNNQLPIFRSRLGDKYLVVNLDGREIATTDETQTKAAMGNLNAFFRNQHKLLAIWPVNDSGFADKVIDRLHLAGGKSALVAAPVHTLAGLQSIDYVRALHLVLSALNVSLDDAAISAEEVSRLAQADLTVGDFLRSVQNLVVSRYDLGDLGAVLPKVYIVITSNDDTYAECRLLRRGNRFLIDPDKLLQFSRANVADDWRCRGDENPRKALPFISSLLEVRLLNISSSAVVNACAFGPHDDLKQAVRTHYNARVSSNAANSMRNSALARALRGEEDVGLAKSSPTPPIQAAYREIQQLSKSRHRAINESIVNVITGLGIPTRGLKYEYHPFPGDPARQLRCDAWMDRGDRPETLEFTHRSDGAASVATVASYVLAKTQDYARDYSLI